MLTYLQFTVYRSEIHYAYAFSVFNTHGIQMYIITHITAVRNPRVLENWDRVGGSFSGGLWWCNSKVPGRYSSDFKSVKSKPLWIKFMGTSCDIAFKWMPQNIYNEKLTLVQVMTCCFRQQAITWTKVDPDLYHHVLLLSHNMLKCFIYCILAN